MSLADCIGRIQLLGESMGRVGISSLLLFDPFEMTDGKCPPPETLVVGSAHQSAVFSLLEHSKALPTLHKGSPYFWTPTNSGCARLHLYSESDLAAQLNLI